MVEIVLLLFFLAVLAYFGISFFNSYRREKLKKKLENYQRMLEQARQSRLSYIRTLEKAENVTPQIEAIESELASMKSKLKKFRLDFRSQLRELRRLSFSDPDFNSDLEMIEQKKVAFTSTWKAADSLKSPYNAKLEEVRTLHKSFSILSNESREKTELWHKDKRIVMKMYDELRSEVKISNPRKVLLRSAKE